MEATMKNRSPSEGTKLYELAAEYGSILDWMDANEDALEAAGGEIPTALAEQLDALDEAFDAKAENVALMIRSLEAHKQMAASEAERLSKLAASYGNRAASLKGYLQLQMQKVGRLKVEGWRCTVALQRNSTCTVRPKDPSHPPADYSYVTVHERIGVVAWELLTRTLNMAGVAAPQGEVGFDGRAAERALKESGDLPGEPGEYEVGSLVVMRGQHLRIR